MRTRTARQVACHRRSKNGIIQILHRFCSVVSSASRAGWRRRPMAFLQQAHGNHQSSISSSRTLVISMISEPTLLSQTQCGVCRCQIVGATAMPSIGTQSSKCRPCRVRVVAAPATAHHWPSNRRHRPGVGQIETTRLALTRIEMRECIVFRQHATAGIDQ